MMDDFGNQLYGNAVKWAYFVGLWYYRPYFQSCLIDPQLNDM